MRAERSWEAQRLPIPRLGERLTRELLAQDSEDETAMRFRAFYALDGERGAVVVLAIGEKVRDRLRIAGREI